MHVYCYKVSERHPVIMSNVNAVSVIVTTRLYCDVAKETGLTDNFPDALNCKDNLFTVTSMGADGCAYTCHDVYTVEVE